MWAAIKSLHVVIWLRFGAIGIPWTPKHVADSLVRDVVAEIGEGTRDPIVAPSAVLLRHADNQRFDLRANSRPPRIGAMLGAVELAGDQTAVPAENRLGLGDTSYLGKKLPAKTFANLRKGASLGVREPEITGQVGAQDPILCDQVFALEE
jgi:hypothetical protein